MVAWHMYDKAERLPSGTQAGKARKTEVGRNDDHQGIGR